MDINEAWDKALKKTEIIRSRVQSLRTFEDTHVPYLLLSESSINVGDTIVRKGEVVVQKPSLILPPNIPQFDGFEFEGTDNCEDNLVNFLLVRGVSVPSLKYNNKTSSLNVYEGGLSKAISYYHNDLQRKENVHTGLIAGPEDCWQFSVLIYSCSQIARNAEMDMRRLLDEYKQKDK